MTDLLRNRPGTTQAMMAVFDDAATLAHALAFVRFEAQTGKHLLGLSLTAFDPQQKSEPRTRS